MQGLVLPVGCVAVGHGAGRHADGGVNQAAQ